jgi:hypothetical protein
MSNSRFASGYLKWDGKKYIIETNLDAQGDKIIINIENDNSKILYFSDGKCKIVQK